MADSKITALASIGTGTDPANDPLVIVDVSDILPGGMSLTGTTKKVTLNNLLACSPTATLASATITGDLTVDTSTLKVDSANNRVGIGTATLFGDLNIQNGSNCRFEVTSQAGGTTIENLNNARNAYLNMTMFADAYIWNRLGSEAMRLNSTGLGVGVTPASGDGSAAFKAAGTGSGAANTRVGLDVREITSGNSAGIWLGAMNNENTGVIGSRTASGNIAFQTFNGASWGERMRIDYLGNVGIGVTPVTGQKLTVLTSIGISASTATAADDRLVFSENMGSVNLGSQIVWKNSSFSTPYASIGVSNGAAGSNGTLIFSTCSSIFTNTNTERVRIKPTGQVRFFPLAADPAGAETGDVYYNSVSNKLKCYNGTIWNDLF